MTVLATIPDGTAKFGGGLGGGADELGTAVATEACAANEAAGEAVAVTVGIAPKLISSSFRGGAVGAKSSSFTVGGMLLTVATVVSFARTPPPSSPKVWVLDFIFVFVLDLESVVCCL